LNLNDATTEQLQTWEKQLNSQYDEIKAKALNLDLTRGKPSADQLALSNALDGILKGDYRSESGIDVRNYGGLDGIPEARQLGAQILGMDAKNVLVGGNSSLTLMHQAMSVAHFFGLDGDHSAWQKQGPVSFICPVPGYDRHFSVCEHLGIKMVTVGINKEGPDMDEVESLIKSDHTIRGMWCVPKYSNPTGVIYSDDVVRRIARLGTTAHKDFRIFWDNAYAIHDLYENPTKLASIDAACLAEGTENSVLQFASTSKVTFAGAGVAFLGASQQNLAGFKQSLRFITIGPDKVNQLRHVKFFAKEGALKSHMARHAAIIRPRFETVLEHLNKAFGDNDLGQWEIPKGGYFISFETRPGLAKEVIKLAGQVGVKLTSAGATYPYGHDPNDSNIRIAPTVPTIEQVKEATEVFVLCVKLASVRQALS
jgi:aspartate/methionine/tyrosine aminotransferase